jgi:hypothetical protein
VVELLAEVERYLDQPPLRHALPGGEEADAAGRVLAARDVGRVGAVHRRLVLL